MTTVELRAEIKDAVDKIPDTALSEVLELLHGLQYDSKDDLELINFVRKSFREDRELLQKLAQ